MSEILDRAESKEVYILCPFQDPIRSCGMHIGIDGKPYEDRGDNQLGVAKECETTMCNSRAYWIL